jgi:hypothetical protein
VVDQPPDDGIDEIDKEGDSKSYVALAGLADAHANQDIGTEGYKRPLPRDI